MTKNTKSLLLLLCVFLLKPSWITAQEQETKNLINFGYRFTTFSENSDKARFQRFNDFRDGITFDVIRLGKETETYSMGFKGNHIGYRNQEFFGSYNKFGKLKTSFGYNQIPLFYSDSTRTLYSSSTPGVLVIDDNIQRRVENRTLKLTNATNNASLVDLKSQRNVFDLELKYTLTSNMAYLLTVKNTSIKGNQPWGTTFGFTLANEIPLPLDQQTTDLGTALELSNKRAFVRFGYDGSFFRNNIAEISWDNPLRITNSLTSGPLMGRQALWPNTNQNTISTTGGIKLPARSYATAYISIGQLSNNNPLIPFTVNSVLPTVPLSRDMSEITAQVLATNYTLTSRPTNWFFVNTRYRQYQFNNKTVPFQVGRSINFDTTVVNLNRESEPLSFNRHTLSADATLSPFSYLGFGTGYTREVNKQTHRAVEESTENSNWASVDLTGISWLSLRGVVEHSVRTSHSFDGMELFAFGNQPSLRQYDISDRNKDRYSVILVVTPISQFSVNSSLATGKENYPAVDTRTVFGLRSNDNHSYSVGFDLMPFEKISFSTGYGYDQYKSFQVSRTANPLPAGGSLLDPKQQFNDPRRDWTDDSTDWTKTYDMSINLLKIIPKTEINLGYGDVRSKSTYIYGLSPNTLITAPVQLPPITNRVTEKTIDGHYFFSKHVVLGLIYRHEEYKVDDFAFNPRENLAEPAAAATQNYLMLGYFQRPYKANMMIGQISYQW